MASRKETVKPDTQLITLKLTDKRENKKNTKFSIEDVEPSATITELSKIIATRLPDQPAWNWILLYIGNRYLEDDKTISHYNRSKRTVLFFDIYERNYLNLKISTIPVIMFGTCICVPLFSFCFRQSFNFVIGDYESVLTLKQRIVDKLADPKGRFDPESLNVIYKGRQLFFNDRDLREEDILTDSKITVPVPLCFRIKKTKGGVSGNFEAEVESNNVPDKPDVSDKFDNPYNSDNPDKSDKFEEVADDEIKSSQSEQKD